MKRLFSNSLLIRACDCTARNDDERRMIGNLFQVDLSQGKCVKQLKTFRSFGQRICSVLPLKQILSDFEYYFDNSVTVFCAIIGNHCAAQIYFNTLSICKIYTATYENVLPNSKLFWTYYFPLGKINQVRFD